MPVPSPCLARIGRGTEWLTDGSVIVVIVTCGVVGLLMRPFRERLLPDRDEPGIERSG